MNIDKDFVFPSHVMFQEFDDEAIILDIRTQEHFGLNPISSFFLKNIQNGIKPLDIYALLLDEYDVSPEQLRSDLNALLDSLLKHQLIEVS